MGRSLRQSLIWIRRNRPSGLVMLIMIAFIVAYTVIIKLDSDRRDIHTHGGKLKTPPTVRNILKHLQNAHDNDSVSDKSGADVIHFAEGLINTQAKVPQNIIDDFAKDAYNDPDADAHTVLYNLNDEPDDKNIEDEPTNHDNKDDKKGDDNSNDEPIELPNENELLINDELERNEEEIEANWDKYLGKDKEKSQKKENKNQLHLRFQGVRSAKKTEIRKSVLTHLSKYVHIFDIFNESKKERDSISKNKCILLRTMHTDAPICIHDPNDDEIISGSIAEKGTWEPNYLYITGSILKLYQDMVFLDLGCNIGVYTILAAKLGRTVVSVDPYKVNLRLLTKSLSLGSLSGRVTLLWNAISDVHENVTVNGIIGNIGGTYVETIKEGDLNKEEFDVANTIVLDDLIDMFIGKTVFIKMDVEAFELNAIEGGPNFFKRIDVRFVLMEWIAHRRSTTADKIIKIMAMYGLYPHVNAHHNTKLEPENSASWPDNVMWIKY